MPKVRNVSPLGEIESWLARRTFVPGEVVDLPAEIVGQAPSMRLLEEGEEPVAGHLLVLDGVSYYTDPGFGLLAQVEHFELVEDEQAAPAAADVQAPADPAPAPAPGPQPAPAPEPAAPAAPVEVPAPAPAPELEPAAPPASPFTVVSSPVYVMGGPAGTTAPTAA